MKTENQNTQFLIEYLDRKKFNYSIDNNPTPEKISSIRRTLERKKSLMDLAVGAYKQVIGG